MKLIDNLSFKKIYFENRTYTGSEILGAAQNMASYIDKNTVNDSPFVYLVASNHIKTLIGLLAILRLGKIVVIVDPQTKTIERSEYYQLAMPSAIIDPKNDKDGFDYSSEITINPSKQTPRISSDIHDVQFVLFTNAEDGHMKAAMLTLENVLHNLESCKEAEILSAKEQTCCALLPFAHIFGLIAGVFIPATSNRNIAIYDIARYQEFRTMTQFIHDTGVSTLFSVPLMYYFFTKVPDIKEQMKTVDAFFSGGVKLENTVYSSFLAKADKEIHEGYGITEACGIAACNHYGRLLMPDTVGTALSCGTISLFNNQTAVTERNTTAEICIKGPSIMKGFLNNEKATAEFITNGWLHTGDLGYINSNGYIVFDGMKKRMLNAAGINVYPAEVERFIKENNCEVASIEVFGEHKPMLGDTVMANVQLHENSAENQKKVKDWAVANLASFKVPKRWNFS